MSIFRNDLLKDRVAFITGGGSGINFVIAQTLFAHGAKVTLVSRSLDRVEKAAATLCTSMERAKGFSADVRDTVSLKKAINETVDAFGHIDILVNGAAGNFVAAADKLSPSGFKAVIDIDTIGTFNACRLCVDQLTAREGVIVNISATQAYLPMPAQVHVGAAKAAIDKMTKDLALEWGKKGIRVVGVAPGPIADTEGMKRLADEEMIAALNKSIPLGRLGQKREIAEAVLFLCSDAARYITGTTLIIDGGQNLTGAGPFLKL